MYERGCASEDIFVQIGIVSFGEDLCADPEYPGVYTRMSSVVDWVKTTFCARTGELCHVTSKSGKNHKM